MAVGNITIRHEEIMNMNATDMKQMLNSMESNIKLQGRVRAEK